MRGTISFKFALMTYGQPAVVAVPLGRALARVRRDAPPTILAFLFTDGGAAVLARPLRGAGARVRPRAVPAVAARRRADGRRAIRVEPAVPVWQAKFKLCFNLRCVAVWVRCYSLNTVSTISRRSCPSLGLSEGRGAEIT